MVEAELTLKDTWLKTLQKVSTTNDFKGQFFLKTNKEFWTFHLSWGRIFYAAGASTQGWQKRFLLHCSELKEKELTSEFLKHSINEPSESWEYHLLFALLETKKIKKEEADRIAFLNVSEALYKTLYATNQIIDFYQIDKKLSDPATIMFSAEELLMELGEFLQIWQGAKMPGSSFELAPILKQPMPWKRASTYNEEVTSLLDGYHTLWDIAAKTNKPVTEVAQLLIPQVLSGVMELVAIGSLPLSTPSEQSLNVSQNLTSRKTPEVIELEKKQSVLPKLHKKIHFNKTVLFIASIVFLSLFSIGLYLFLSKQTFNSTLDTNAVASPTPAFQSNISSYAALADVPQVPDGTFSYGGALSFAPLRSQIVVNALAQAHPQFKLRYREPLIVNPGDDEGVDMLLHNELSLSQNSRSLTSAEYNFAKAHNFTLYEQVIGIDAVVFLRIQI